MEQRVAHCLLISKVLVADGIMTENEREFLDHWMRKMGLSEAERKQVIDLEGWDEAEPVIAKMSEEDKRAMIETLVSAASADGRLSPLEVAAVKKITLKLGL